MAPVVAKTTWRKRLKRFCAQQVRQLPCLHAMLTPLKKLKFCSRNRYQTIGQSEDDAGDTFASQDNSQSANEMLGKVMTRLGLVLMLVITVIISQQSTSPTSTPDEEDPSIDIFGNSPKGYTIDDFKRDMPIVLYIGAMEVLMCGACATTLAGMYRLRRHSVTHPGQASDRDSKRYIKVELHKEPGSEELYGIGFRPSTDGLECLIVEEIHPGSLMDRWNMKSLTETRSAQELLDEAFGDDDDGHAIEESNGASPPAALPDPGALEAGVAAIAARMATKPQVELFSVIVAVNDVSGDVGMMQVQLLKPSVTLWIQNEMSHASNVERSVFWEDPQLALPQAPGSGVAPSTTSADRNERSLGDPQAFSVGPTFLGRSDEIDAVSIGALSVLGLPTIAKRTLCACVGLEDEELQILARWTVCSLIFGWVPMLPVLLMQPHSERPRQHLFRQHLLKPCLVVLPLWGAMWILDVVEVIIAIQIVPPMVYFSFTHMLLPGILAYNLVRMQAADEKLAIDQRKAREEMIGPRCRMVSEDPSPTLFKEFISMNPVALIALGACASIPLVVSCLLTPMQTARGKLGQHYMTLIFGPCTFLQLGFIAILLRTHFLDLPRMYVAAGGLLFSLPCIVMWCFCLLCASRYGRNDLDLVINQRFERALQRLDIKPDAIANEDKSVLESIVDCTAATYREYELLYTA